MYISRQRGIILVKSSDVIFVFYMYLQEGLLGIFQKLIASKTNDNYGFELVTAIIEKVPQ